MITQVNAIPTGMKAVKGSAQSSQGKNMNRTGTLDLNWARGGGQRFSCKTDHQAEL